MEAIIALLLIAVLALPLILLIWFKVSTSSQIKDAIYKINSVSTKVDQLREDLVSDKVDDVVNEEEIDKRVERFLDIVPKPEEKKENVSIKKEPISEGKSEPKLEPITPKKQVNPVAQAAFVAPKKKKKRDIEKFVGENLLNKIGIGVLVLGIAYFVKYAIDKHWINEVGRVVIGLLSGGLLNVFAHRIRKTYKAFSSVLVGGAMAVFYYTISIAFHDYELFSQPVAFALMVGVTGFSVLLSISYDKKELAVLSLLGAFSTPLMLSTGEGNYVILFTYLAIVNVGMLVLAYFKKWNIINITSFGLTVLMYGMWFMDSVVHGIKPPYKGALVFAGLYYVVFFLMHIVNNLKEKRKFKHYEFGLLLANTGAFYAVGMSVLNLSGNGQLQGLFTVLLGLFNLLFAYPMYKRTNVDRSLVFLLMGSVLTFVSLAAPVQLSGNHITLFWASEMVLLLWLGQKSKLKLVKLSSMLIYGLMLVSLLMDWEQLYLSYHEVPLTVLLNKGFITTLFAVGASIFYARLLNNENETASYLGISMKLAKSTAHIVVGALVYFMGCLELGYQVGGHYNHEHLAALSILAWTFAFTLGLINFARIKELNVLQSTLAIAAVLLVFIYPVFNPIEQILRNDVLHGQLAGVSLLVNYVNLGLSIALAVWFVGRVKSWYGLESISFKATTWVFTLFGVLIFSMQLNHQTVLLFYDAARENMHFINKQTIKIGYPILWGVGSFGLMLAGMKYKLRVLRIVSLSVFALVLLKLFLFDIKGASEAGKIVAFILLGVLLLVISFMYQKLKNLILEDGSTKK